MKKLMFIVLMSMTVVAHAGVAEVIAAEKAILEAKAQVAAMKKALSKKEKAELAVAVATLKLAKLNGE